MLCFMLCCTGVGGFSTPMALATPMLVSLGHDPLSSLVAVVGLNGLAAHLGKWNSGCGQRCGFDGAPSCTCEYTQYCSVPLQ